MRATGDDAVCPWDAVAAAVRYSAELAYDLLSQAGDAAIVDNFVLMHGRRTFTGPRKLLASAL